MELITWNFIASKPDESKDCKPLIFLYCFKEIANEVDRANVLIEGGVRIKDIRINWASRLDKIKKSLQTPDDNAIVIKDLSKREKNIIEEINTDFKRVLAVRPSTDGDYSRYRLWLVNSKDPSIPLQNFDMLLSHIDFSFKVECHSGFDCSPDQNECPPTALNEPVIDYMAKDYASFRRLVFDRLSNIIPAWNERNPSDVGVMLVEVLSYLGDHLSYYQDAVATEAYLGTSRRRISAKRHTRLLDYHINEGSNARAWIWFELDASTNSLNVPKKTLLLTNRSSNETEVNIGYKNSNGGADSIIVTKDEFDKAVSKGEVEAFETMYEATLYHSHNEIRFYTWGDSKCCLPKGATHATIRNDENALNLKVGDILIFEEIRSPTTGRVEDADPKKASCCTSYRYCSN